MSQRHRGEKAMALELRECWTVLLSIVNNFLPISAIQRVARVLNDYGS